MSPIGKGSLSQCFFFFFLPALGYPLYLRASLLQICQIYNMGYQANDLFSPGASRGLYYMSSTKGLTA